MPNKLNVYFGHNNKSTEALTREFFEVIGDIFRLISPSVDTVSLAEAVAYFVRAQASDPTIMALFGTNDDVHAFNQLVADAKDMQVSD